MPLVRISVFDSMPTEKRGKLPTAVYDAMRETIEIPHKDLFVVLTAHLQGELIGCHDPGGHRFERETL